MEFDFVSGQFEAYKLGTLEEKRKLGIEYKVHLNNSSFTQECNVKHSISIR